MHEAPEQERGHGVVKQQGPHSPYPNKARFPSATLFWAVLLPCDPLQPLCLTWSQAPDISGMVLSHCKNTCAARALLYNIKQNHLRKSKMQQAGHHAFLSLGWDRRERATCGRCHVKHHMQMGMLCSAQDMCIMHLQKLDWLLPFTHTYIHILTGLMQRGTYPDGQLFCGTMPAYLLRLV